MRHLLSYNPSYSLANEAITNHIEYKYARHHAFTHVEVGNTQKQALDTEMPQPVSPLMPVGEPRRKLKHALSRHT